MSGVYPWKHLVVISQRSITALQRLEGLGNDLSASSRCVGNSCLESRMRSVDSPPQGTAAANKHGGTDRDDAGDLRQALK